VLGKADDTYILNYYYYIDMRATWKQPQQKNEIIMTRGSKKLRTRNQKNNIFWT
jgi:hypothetical protein